MSVDRGPSTECLLPPPPPRHRKTRKPSRNRTRFSSSRIILSIAIDQIIRLVASHILYIEIANKQQIGITFLIDQDSSDSSGTCQKLFCIKIRPRESFRNCQEWGTFLTASSFNKILSSHVPVYGF